MTRLLTTGWETGDANEAGVSTTGSSTVTAVSSTPTPRTPGSYCLKCLTTSTSTNQAYKTFTFSSSKTEIWVRFGFLAHLVSLTEDMFALLNDSASANQCSLTYSTDGLIRLYRGLSSGTLLATSSASLTQDTWHTVEWRTLISTSTTGTSEVWLDGTQVINFSGDNSNTANLNVQRLFLGHITTGGGTGTYHGFDDLAVNDTAGSINLGRPGDGRVVLLKPNGAGSNTVLTRGGTDSGANWSQVDELLPAMTDYVYSAVADGTARDTYALENVPAGAWAVNCCEVLAYGLNSDAGTGSLGLTVKSGATTNEGSAQNLSTTAAYYRQLYELDPNTSAAWTVTNVSALEAGVTVR